MNRPFIDLISSSKSLKNFLTKSYGLELLFTLDELASKQVDNSIDDTYKCIVYYKPKSSTFSQFCSSFKDIGVIDQAPSTTKNIKRILLLSEGSIQQLQDVRINLQNLSHHNTSITLRNHISLNLEQTDNYHFLAVTKHGQD